MGSTLRDAARPARRTGRLGLVLQPCLPPQMPPKRRPTAKLKDPPPGGAAAAVASSAASSSAETGLRDDDGHGPGHDPIQDGDAPAPHVIPAEATVTSAAASVEASAGIQPIGVAARAGAAFDTNTGHAGGSRCRGATLSSPSSSSRAAARTRREGKAKAAMPPPPARPPVRYLRGGGFGAVGYPRIDLELSAARARIRRFGASIRELNDEFARTRLEVDEVQAGMKNKADENDGRIDELGREVDAILAASAIRVDLVRLAAASEMTRQARELVATSKARLAVWRETNEACKRKFEAVARKRQRILLVFEKYEYLHRTAPQGGRAAMAAGRRGGPPYDDDDDSD
jgi:hypothetical protein